MSSVRRDPPYNHPYGQLYTDLCTVGRVVVRTVVRTVRLSKQYTYGCQYGPPCRRPYRLILLQSDWSRYYQYRLRRDANTYPSDHASALAAKRSSGPPTLHLTSPTALLLNTPAFLESEAPSAPGLCRRSSPAVLQTLPRAASAQHPTALSTQPRSVVNARYSRRGGSAHSASAPRTTSHRSTQVIG